MAIAELFASLKRTVTTLHTTFDELGKQTEKMSNMAPAIKVEEQVGANQHFEMVGRVLNHLPV